VEHFSNVIVVALMMKGTYCLSLESSESEIDTSSSGDPSEDADSGDPGVGSVSGDEIGVVIRGNGKGVRGDTGQDSGRVILFAE